MMDVEHLWFSSSPSDSQHLAEEGQMGAQVAEPGLEPGISPF
jgi:hypothetical protein